MGLAWGPLYKHYFPLGLLPVASYPTRMISDFNINHNVTYNLCFYSAQELATLFEYISSSSELGFGLKNEPLGYPCIPLRHPSPQTVLVFSDASPLLLPFTRLSYLFLLSTGLDHVSVLIII